MQVGLERFNTFKEVKVEKREGVLTVTLDNPEQGNPTTWTLLVELNEIWRSFHDDDEVRAIILAGAGPDFSYVSPGTVLHPPEEGPPHPLRNLELAGTAIHGDRPDHISSLHALLDVPQPIIVAIQGKCTGLATNLALHCDIIIAAEDARISDPHIVRGIVPGDGGAVIWPLLIGPARAKEYLFTGDSLSGTEAARIGLINRAVPASELADTAWVMAKRLADGPPLAIRFTKHAINRVISHQLDLVWELADAYQVMTTLTEDAREARKAAAEKRPPRFIGR